MVNQYDLISVGGGLGGFVAALRAHELGLRPLILEKTNLLGGVAAYSGGSAWIPNTDIARAAGYDDTPQAAARYMDFLGDGKAVIDEQLRDAFLASGPEAIRFLTDIGVPFHVTDTPDSAFPNGDGSKRAGRVLGVIFNGIELGRYQAMLRRSPYYPRPGISHMELNAAGSFRQAVADAAAELDERTRNDRLTFGGGLMASLIHAALLERGIECRTRSRALRLLADEGRVVGVVFSREDGAEVTAHGAVMLATGSYGYAPFAAQLEGLPDFSEQAPPVGEGDALLLAGDVGAAVVRAGNGFCTIGFRSKRFHPGTRIPMHLPLIGSVGLPHGIVVNQKGRRFGDESQHGTFMSAFRGTGGYGGVRFENWPAFWICDDEFRREGHEIMGARDSWPGEDLVRSDTLAQLADALEIDRAGLESTVGRFNEFATTGHDLDFDRGAHAGFRPNRNEERLPNPSLGALTRPPFWGARVQILGAGMGSHGLRIDAKGRVLSWRGLPIEGLYATGNATAFTDHPFGYQDGLANARNITYAFIGATTAAATTERTATALTTR